MATALICEDDPFIRSLIGIVLRRSGFDVHTAEDGKKALELVLAKDFDLVVLDLMMPVVNGFQVVTRLQEERPDIIARILVTTASTSVLHETFPAPVAGVITKPFDIEELTRAVTRFRSGN